MDIKWVVVFMATAAIVMSVSVASAEFVTFVGQINDSQGNGIPGAHVEITKDAHKWTAETLDESMPNMTGVFGCPERVKVPDKSGIYRLKIDGQFAEDRYWEHSDFKKYFDWQGTPVYVGEWYYPPYSPEEIPEFSTIAIPVVTIIALLFLFNSRKKKK